MELNPGLLESSLIGSPVDLKACLNSHGLYNSVQFVLRLSPEVHRRIANLPPGIVYGGLHPDDLQAYSTYLHETIHWWQHVGSTTGLMLSLSFPAQAHVNYSHLKRLIERIGPKKSVLRWLEAAPGGGGPDTSVGLANIVVNNHFDIEFFRILVTSPKLAAQAVQDKFFDSVGHSYATAYANTLLILADTLDEQPGVIVDPRGWEDEFAVLRANQAKGYYVGSSVRVSPIGAHQIFEGQARFAQLQFLYFSSGGGLSWDDARSKGMLAGLYGEAFEAFLQLTSLTWPPSIDHPIVALFLLVCDIAVNPGAGFPMPLRSFGTFIEDIDPGLRFLFLCRAIATKCPEVRTAIRDYSRAEYTDVSETLTRHLIIDAPLAIAETIGEWVDGSQKVRSLMAEHRSFAFAPGNLPVRVLLSHFVSFNQDKLLRPEFFCWPGAWMAGERVSSEIALLFDRHSAPFIDKPDDAGVYPRLMPGKKEATVREVFNGFYAMNVTYDLTRQWVISPGPFDYDFSWLSSSGTESEFKHFGDIHFEKIYGAHPDSFELV